MVNNRDKTHCIRGHEFTVENTYATARQRQCRTCAQVTKAKYKKRVAALASAARMERIYGELNTPLLTPEQASYLAGLIDGEGTISASRHPDNGYGNCGVVVKISMASKEPLATVAMWLEGAALRWQVRPSPNHRAVCNLTLTGRPLIRVLRACRPFLILKAGQADLALVMEETRLRDGGKGRPVPPALLAELERCVAEIQALNRREANHTPEQSGASGKPVVPRRLEGHQAAYLAGLFDGEGCISASLRTHPVYGTARVAASAAIQMASAEPLATMAEWLEVAPPTWETGPKLPNQRRRCRLGFAGARVLPVLYAIRPHLLLKGEQADIAIAIVEDYRRLAGVRGRKAPTQLVQRLTPHVARLRVLNGRGSEKVA